MQESGHPYKVGVEREHIELGLKHPSGVLILTVVLRDLLRGRVTLSFSKADFVRLKNPNDPLLPEIEVPFDYWDTVVYPMIKILTNDPSMLSFEWVSSYLRENTYV